jgi:hypothetical protein
LFGSAIVGYASLSFTLVLVQAIKLDPADAVLFSNRSLCHLKCGEAHDALLDANACIGLKPEWHKGYYRKGAALRLLLVRQKSIHLVFCFIDHHLLNNPRSTFLLLGVQRGN